MTAELILRGNTTQPIDRGCPCSAAEDRLRALPGVTHAAIHCLPFTTMAPWRKTSSRKDPFPLRANSLRAHYFSSVTPDYWKAMNIPCFKALYRDSDTADPPV